MPHLIFAPGAGKRPAQLTMLRNDNYDITIAKFEAFWHKLDGICIPNMKTVIFMLLLLSLCLNSIKATKQGASRGGSAAIPRKVKHSSFVGRLGQGTVGRVIRELKTSFCSDLEAVSLQVTKPTPDAVSLSLIDDLVTFINTEYGDQSTVTNLIIKLSRKYGEANAYSMLKAVFVLHTLHDTATEQARGSLSKALLGLQSETDEKTSKLYFDKDYIRTASQASSTAAELCTVDLVRTYSQYMLDYFAARSEADKVRSSPRFQVPSAALVAKLQRLQEVGGKVLTSLEETATPLSEQCTGAVRKTQTWIAGEILRLGSVPEADKLAEVGPSGNGGEKEKPGKKERKPQRRQGSPKLDRK